MLNTTAPVLNTLGLFASCMTGYMAFLRASSRPEVVQRGLLRQILAENHATVYGGQHGFARIKNYDDFKNVPLCEYSDLNGYITRIAQGEKNILTCQDVLALVPTSGSSSATKLIPCTAGLLRQFRSALAPWIAELFIQSPALLAGKQYWVTSPHTSPDPGIMSQIRIGFMPDAAYLGALQRKCSAGLMCVPHETAAVRDTDSFLYITALFLLREENLRLISVWHPSFITIMADTIRKHYAALVDDIYSGSLNSSAVPDSLEQAMFTRHLRPCPQRARYLQSIDMQCAALGHAWPHLRLLSCWADGGSSQYVPSLAAQFPSAHIQPKGLLATEGVVSIPFGRAGGRVAAVNSHFFEFIDAGTGDILPLWRLEQDGIYSTVLTTGAGLYRYRLHDLVRVTGFFRRLPQLEFISRDNCVSDLVGEKLHLEHIEGLISRCASAYSVRFNFAMLAPDRAQNGTGYIFFFSSDRLPDAHALQAQLEQGLMENYYYRHARALAQLRPVRLYHITGEPLRAYNQRLLEGGGGLGDIKILALRTETDWAEIFEGSYITQ